MRVGWQRRREDFVHGFCLCPLARDARYVMAAVSTVYAPKLKLSGSLHSRSRPSSDGSALAGEDTKFFSFLTSRDEGRSLEERDR